MRDETIGVWLSELAAKKATPGGGAAAALLAATAAALIGMVTNYTTGEKWAGVEAQMKEINESAASLRAKALALIKEDANAFSAVETAYKLPSENTEEKRQRKQAIQKALIKAAEPPVETAELSGEIVELAAELVENSNPNVISDVAVAAAAARAALEAAFANILVNQKYIENNETKEALNGAMEGALQAIEAADKVTAAVIEKLK